jgi:hypothetical protein
MPEIKNTFLKSKMNQDLDARLLPNGEYREAFNVSISKSEGDDVGALENIKGNSSLVDFDFKFVQGSNLDALNPTCIGSYVDTTLNIGFFFFTTYSDSSSDGISNQQTKFGFFTGDNNWIVYYNFKDDTSYVLCTGPFLNFSKTSPVVCKSLEDLLFWTDNRNQPRKLNWKTAINNPDYYTHEDHISVAKYYPWNPIRLYKTYSGNIENTARNKTDRFLPAGNIFTIKTIDPLGPQPISGGFSLNITTTNTGSNGYGLPGPDGFSLQDFYATFVGNGENSGPPSNALISVNSVTNASSSTYNIDIRCASESALLAVKANMQINIHQESSDYDADWAGDKEFLKERFVRFSYRFKFDDNEYSLIAPFTQEVFIPEQYGCFIGEDDEITKNSLIASFMKNLVNEVEVIIDLPYQNGNQIRATDLFTKLKVKEIDILYKASDEELIKVVDTLDLNDINNTGSFTSISYSYISREPIKTLPQSEMTRVYDQVPLRASSLEIVGNRVVYGNFVAKNSYPEKINYEVSIDAKGIPSTGTNASYADREYPVHNLKQNRTYQVGFVLADRYGRQSEVILSTNDVETSTSGGINYGGSTIYHPYRDQDTYAANWWGDDLKLLLNEVIPNDTTSSQVDQDYPGLAEDDITSGNYNPLGWYTYKIVVKQQEQDYYNVYVPGVNSRIPKVNYAESPGTNGTSGLPDSGEPNKGNNFETPVFDSSGNVANKGSRNYVFDQLLTFSFDGKVQIELTGENINKVPKSLLDVGPRDREFAASDVKLFGRVRSTNYKNNSQYFPSTSSNNVKPDTVDSIREFNTFGIDPLYCKHSQAYPITGATKRPYFFILYDFYNGGGILNKQSNTFIATINQANNVPMGYDTDFVDSVSYVNSASGASTVTTITSPFSARYLSLAVYETKPVKSEIDIFYESSTSGIIKDLNSTVDEPDVVNYLKLGDGSGTSITNNDILVTGFNEATAVNTVLTGDIVPMFELNTTMDAGTTLSIHELYINNVKITEPSLWFDLITSNNYTATSSGNITSYKLRSKSDNLYYGQNGDEFYIVLKAINGGGSGDISYISMPRFRQTNIAPSIDTQPLLTYTISAFQPGQATQTLFYVYPYPGTNAGTGDVVISNGSTGSDRGVFNTNITPVNFSQVFSQWDSTVGAWEVFVRNSYLGSGTFFVDAIDDGGLKTTSNNFGIIIA